MPIKIGNNGNKNFTGGFVGVNGSNKKIVKVLTGIGGSNKLIWEEKPKGSLKVTFYKSDNGYIPNLSVSLVRSTTGEAKTLTTNSQGTVVFYDIEPANYFIRITNASSYRDYRSEPISIGTSQVTKAFYLTPKGTKKLTFLVMDRYSNKAIQGIELSLYNGTKNFIVEKGVSNGHYAEVIFENLPAGPYRIVSTATSKYPSKSYNYTLNENVVETSTSFEIEENLPTFNVNFLTWRNDDGQYLGDMNYVISRNGVRVLEQRTDEYGRLLNVRLKKGKYDVRVTGNWRYYPKEDSIDVTKDDETFGITCRRNWDA